VTGESAARSARFVSLRVRLLGLVLLVIVPWLALVLYTQADERAAAIAGVRRDAMRVLDIVRGNQAAQIEAARQLLTTLARLPQLHAPATCESMLAQLLDAYSQYANFLTVDADGNVTCSAVPTRASINVRDRTYFERAVESRRFAVGDYQIGRITLVPAINYAYPLFRSDGSLDSMVVAAQGLSWLGTVAAELSLPAGAVFTLSDPRGTVLARVPPEPGLIGEPMPERDLLATLAGASEGGVLEAGDAQGVPRLWVHAPTIAGVNVGATIGVSKAAAFATIDRRLARNLLALGVVTLLGVAAAWYGGELMLRRVDALLAATRQLASGDLDARAKVAEERSELDLLARAFNGMAATLQARDRDLRVAEEKTRAAEVELAVTRAHLDIARQIQQALLPQVPLTLGNVRLAGRCMPAAAVGGDYFGYFPRAGNGVDSFVGDVAGHGVGAALLMAEARTTFLAERLASSSAADILGKLNALLYEDLDRSRMFMTACCATFDAAKRELSYANAGHPPAILLSAGQPQCTTISADGSLLGVDRDARFAEVRVKLREGDVVVFYTDGITERSNVAGELFGVDRLNELVVAHRDDEPEAMIDAVFEALHRFAGAREHEDDLTIVVMKQTA
jgi:serine phosphatase RsbU (regulator of sigma subunit)